MLDAPVTVVWAADNRSAALVPKALDLMRRDGAPEAYLRIVPVYINLFAGGFGFLAKLPPLRALFNFIGYITRKVWF